MHVEATQVMVWFGRPIVPEVVSYPARTVAAEKDPPLDVDELPGWLSAWQKREDGWWAMLTYRFPTNGIGLQNYIAWFPGARLRRI